MHFNFFFRIVLIITMQQKSSKVDIWSSLLSDFSSSASQPSKFLHKKSVVVFGDELTGKSTLATKLCGVGADDRFHHGNGLDYHELVVKGDDDDESTTCNVWVTDGHLSHRFGLFLFVSGWPFTQLPQIDSKNKIKILDSSG